MNTIFTSPICEMSELKDLFIELTAKNCNTRCRHCYIDFPYTKSVKDFIKVEKVRHTLSELKNENLRCIYFVGAEPMTHPDFNTILRLCLTKTNVCILTNASFINEKKSRFLKSVENSSDYQIIFKLSFSHYEELKNDNVRYRGSFRQNMYALKCFEKYEFRKIVCVSNYYKEPHNVIVSEFQEKLSDCGVEEAIIQVTEWNNNTDTVFSEVSGDLDCKTGRVLTSAGIFACPFLANDYRGRVGSSFSDYSKTVRLETSYCATCIKNNDKMFSLDIDW